MLQEHSKLCICEDELRNFQISSVLTKTIADAVGNVNWANLIVPIGSDGALIRWTDSNIADGLQHRIRVLPWLALNEVFMGEFMAARTSTMSFQADGKTECKIRSSGMCAYAQAVADIHDDVEALQQYYIQFRLLKVKSRGFDAGFILNGSISLPFNDDTTAVFEIHPEDALKTIQLK
ncbi:hypothetical protein PV327_003535 [Microctonus hyperodae]|uniref:Uncharacterized protein n=1 Tax=Microctonus hyperodae TaxID=165561 RepID=A0AA39G4K0_MICHY|nr:hypothetical protein PV327_003535 [Microctonus hyperodae]